MGLTSLQASSLQLLVAEPGAHGSHRRAARPWLSPQDETRGCPEVLSTSSSRNVDTGGQPSGILFPPGEWRGRAA